MIDTIIPLQRFEEIRDKIGEILAIELSNQAALTGRTELNPEIWVERTTPFDSAQLPALLVEFANSQVITYNPRDARYSLTYNLFVVNKSKASVIDGKFILADQMSLINTQRICGLIRSIITHPLYLRLGFAPGFVETRNIESVVVEQKEAAEDSEATTVGMIVLKVNVSENNTTVPTINLAGADTIVSLEGTEEGFKYVLNT